MPRESGLFEDVIGRFVQRSLYSSGQLALLSGVPKRTIVNWLEGRVRRPRDPRGLLKIAAALRLAENEVSDLLESAGYPSITKLLAQVINRGDREQIDLLSPWIKMVSSLHQIDSPPPDFIGREHELKELITAAQNDNASTLGIFGPAGVGKTTLALKLAESLISKYLDAQLFVDMKGTSPDPLSAADVMEYIIHSFNPVAKLPEQDSELKALKALYLSTLHNQKALLFIDNVGKVQHVSQIIPPSNCALLITSRHHFTLPGLVAVNLNPLLPTESSTFLIKKAPRIGTLAEKIAKLCDHLPLSLRLAGDMLALRSNLAPLDYVQQLEDTQQRLQVIDSSLEQSIETVGVEASLDLSYQLIEEEMQKLWCQLAIFPHSFDLAAAAAIWALKPHLAQEVLSRFLERSLIEWDTSAGRYKLHDLTRLFLDSRLEKAERPKSKFRHARHYLSVLESTRDLYEEGGDALLRGLEWFDLEWPNIQASILLSKSLADENDTAAKLFSDYMSEGWYLLRMRLKPSEQLDWYKSALRTVQRIGDREGEGKHFKHISDVYMRIGEWQKAIEL